MLGAEGGAGDNRLLLIAPLNHPCAAPVVDPILRIEPDGGLIRQSG